MFATVVRLLNESSTPADNPGMPLLPKPRSDERCVLCGCRVHRRGVYATPTVEGRSHATSHHYVAERFFGRSAMRRGEQREGIFSACPWGIEGKSAVYC